MGTTATIQRLTSIILKIDAPLPAAEIRKPARREWPENTPAHARAPPDSGGRPFADDGRALACQHDRRRIASPDLGRHAARRGKPAFLDEAPLGCVAGSVDGQLTSPPSGRAGGMRAINAPALQHRRCHNEPHGALCASDIEAIGARSLGDAAACAGPDLRSELCRQLICWQGKFANEYGHPITALAV
jgi:hypothetical protein